MNQQDKAKFTFLKQEDVIAAGVLNMEQALIDVEKAFIMYANGEVIQPNKTLIEFPDEKTGQRKYVVVSMPIYMGGDIKRAGVKWAAESMDNARSGVLPYGIDLLILHDLEHAHPIAIMDGTLITAVRTGAAAGIAAKYLARAGTKKAVFIGAGVIGRMVIDAITKAIPSLVQGYLFDTNMEKAEKLADEFSNRLPFSVVNDLSRAIRDADIIATMTTTRSSLIKKEWLQDGSLVIAMGKNEIADDAIIEADLIVTDEWATFKEAKTTNLFSLYNQGKLAEENVVNLRDIITGNASGRLSSNDCIQFHSFGMACEDLIIAERIFRESQKLDLGIPLSLWNNPLWL